MKPQRWSNKPSHRRHSSQNGGRPLPPWMRSRSGQGGPGQGGQGGQGQNNHGPSRPRHHFSSRPPMRPNNQNEISPAEQHFLSLTSVDPFPRITLETGLSEYTTRAVDLLAPVGKGQRGLIVSPPKSGKTTILKHMCQAITKSDPTVKVYCLLVDERPEEVTDFRRNVTAEEELSVAK